MFVFVLHFLFPLLSTGSFKRLFVLIGVFHIGRLRSSDFEPLLFALRFGRLNCLTTLGQFGLPCLNFGFSIGQLRVFLTHGGRISLHRCIVFPGGFHEFVQLTMQTPILVVLTRDPCCFPFVGQRRLLFVLELFCNCRGFNTPGRCQPHALAGSSGPFADL